MSENNLVSLYQTHIMVVEKEDGDLKYYNRHYDGTWSRQMVVDGESVEKECKGHKWLEKLFQDNLKNAVIEIDGVQHKGLK